MTCTRAGGRRRLPAGACIAAILTAGCASAGVIERTYTHTARYRVSCSVSDECRVQYLDQEGKLRASDIVGEWHFERGVDPGDRVWIRASGGGCPPRPLRVEILLDETPVARDLTRAEHASRCDWLMAETEFVIP